VIQSSKDSRFDIDYLGESTKGDMNVRPDIVDNFENEGVAATLGGPIEEVAKAEAKEAEALLDALKIPVRFGISSHGLKLKMVDWVQMREI
jgi:hypothetical protein